MKIDLDYIVNVSLYLTRETPRCFYQQQLRVKSM